MNTPYVPPPWTAAARCRCDRRSPLRRNEESPQAVIGTATAGCRRPRLSWLAIAALLAGCATAPDSRPPVVETPAAWSVAAPGQRPVELTTWWTAWGDPGLNELVELALAGNPDLDAASARLRQARAARAVAVSAGGPSLDASSALRRSHSAGSTREGVTVGGSDSDSFQAGVDASWEADLFGRVRSGVEAAEADVQAAVEAQAAVRVSLVAEVARTHVDIRVLRERLRITRENLDAQTRTRDIIARRTRAGLQSGLDEANADSQLASTAAQIPRLESSLRQTQNALAALCGQLPGALDARLAARAEASPPLPAPPSAGIPSDLPRRRPDIRRAEQAIRAAAARVGATAADFYPRLRLGASAGVQNTDSDDPFSPLREFWSVGPSATWSLYDRGRTRASVDVQEALREQALIDYRKTVLTAWREVEDALSSASRERERRVALEQAVTASRRAAGLADKLYAAGQTDFLNVLIARRAQLAAEEALAQNTSDLASSLASLYKALGGGW